jgi:hypothetical protein
VRRARDSANLLSIRGEAIAMARLVRTSATSRAKSPASPRAHRAFMRSYTTDAEGNKVLIGLTLRETVDYEEYRDTAMAERKPGRAQDRFQELHRKHMAARAKRKATRRG